MTENINMGGTSVFTKTQGIKFADGTEQDTAAVTPNPGAQSLQTGVAVFTGGTSSAVVFGTTYTGVLAPTVVVTGLDGVYTHGLSFSLTVAGTNGAWTGFTLNLSGALFGAFNWIAIGN
jgi:hypothetical protein